MKLRFTCDDGSVISHLPHLNGGCTVSPAFFFPLHFFTLFLLYACAGGQRDKRWERCQQIVALDKKVGVHDRILSV